MNNNHHYRFLIITVLLIVAVLISILIYTKIVNSPIITGNQMIKITVAPTVVKPSYGSMTIKNSDDSLRHSVADYLRLDVIVDSNQADIVGYDCLIQYDTKAFELIQVDSDLTDFSVFKMTGENKLTITGTKKLDATNTNKLVNKKIATMTLKPKKTGKFNFQLLTDYKKEKTQLVDTGSNIYFPKVNNIEIEIY